ncbi:Octicosapeptide/Phox/Bem1p family protein [Heracleum sosnowskyi]|uniref:Octicosapeptide/Phox/Bem1p family protein n=1 Tax=Heracleum sosnowskyi TaxID=360622 RepID=A0AAD8NCZ7_9APIA|nr:Octicosapeptide/Phox/Bem1p family protein [Heracleum sosnowskyi]
MIALSLNTQTLNLKFLCSYGGKILPRYPDGKLRYHGGHTRVLSVPRSISFSELLVKLGELCGTNCVSLRCQLPTEDLDALVSITSDEDLLNLIEEYDRAESVKIRAVLSLPKSTSPPHSSASNSPKSPSNSPIAANGYHGNSRFSPVVSADHSPRHTPTQAGYGMLRKKTAGYANGNPMRVQLIHNANHWQ